MNIFWFRRDLRLDDNKGLYNSLKNDQTQPIFIFDKNILDKLEESDARLTFIHNELEKINQQLSIYESSIEFYYGYPLEIWQSIVKSNNIKNVFWNNDYEPYSIKRDDEIRNLLIQNKIQVQTFKDQVIFEESEITKDDGKPYTIFTPYKNKWLSKIKTIEKFNCESYYYNLKKSKSTIIPLDEMGFIKSKIEVKDYSFLNLENYDKFRDYPFKDQTSYLSPHLRFGTISVRECVSNAIQINEIFLSELIWREFFKQILFHFPYVLKKPFKIKYSNIIWINNLNDFEAWKNGVTGYPLVDAGMRELNETGYMHNRVRMITASFLIKHLLIDWRWGEKYFAKKLLDFDLSSNNGNWQWAAGTGCDSAPYFRIFNPISQLKKFDQALNYSKKWIKDFDRPTYPKPIIEHKYARERCLRIYKEGLM